MPDTLSRLDLFNIGANFLLARAKRIEAAIVRTLGSDANIFIGSVSFMAHAVMKQLTKAEKRQFLATSEGEDLDRWLWDRYSEKRKGASAAVTEVDLVRPNAAVGGGTVPRDTQLFTINGIGYILLEDAVFGATDLSVTAVSVRAQNAGKAFQVGRNYIRRFANQGALFDTSITVNNPSPAAGGEDRELDPVVKERMRDFWRTQQRGTLPAIEFGATETPGVASASAAEALTGSAQPARVVTAYFADSSGVASKTLSDAVLANLEDFRCAGIAVLPELGQPQLVDVIMQLAFEAGVETNLLAQTIRTAVLGYINSLGVNQTLELGALMGLLLRYKSQGLVTKDSTFIEPVGNVEPLPGRTIRTTLDRVKLAA